MFDFTYIGVIYVEDLIKLALKKPFVFWFLTCLLVMTTFSVMYLDVLLHILVFQVFLFEIQTIWKLDILCLLTVHMSYF